MKIGITCYPTYGGSGVVATELGIELADRDHEIHFITYSDRKSTRLNSSHLVISYAVFFLKIKNINHTIRSVSDDITNILCSSGNMRRAIPLILRLLLISVNLTTNLAIHFFILFMCPILAG